MLTWGCPMGVECILCFLSLLLICIFCLGSYSFWYEFWDIQVYSLVIVTQDDKWFVWYLYTIIFSLMSKIVFNTCAIVFAFLFFIDITIVYLLNISMIVNRYLIPLLLTAEFCMSARSICYFMSGHSTIVCFCYLWGICLNVWNTLYAVCLLRNSLTFSIVIIKLYLLLFRALLYNLLMSFDVVSGLIYIKLIYSLVIGAVCCFLLALSFMTVINNKTFFNLNKYFIIVYKFYFQKEISTNNK